MRRPHILVATLSLVAATYGVGHGACALAELGSNDALRCGVRHDHAVRRCLRRATPLACCDTTGSGAACGRLPTACRPDRTIDAITAAALGAAPTADRCRWRLARRALRLHRRSLVRARNGTYTALAADLARCEAAATRHCRDTPALGPPCDRAGSPEEAAACLCRLALPSLAVTTAFRDAPCPSAYAAPTCAGPPTTACHEAFVTGGGMEACTVGSGRATHATPPALDGGVSRAWAFPTRPRGRQFHTRHPATIGSVRAVTDGLGSTGSRAGASNALHLRLSAEALTSRLLVVRWFTGELPTGTEARLRMDLGTDPPDEVVLPPGSPTVATRAALVAWSGDLDLAVSGVVTAPRDLPVASADLLWRLDVLEPGGDDDSDGVANAVDSAPFDREVPSPPATSTRPRVLVIGLDGAGWDILDPLMAAGYLPVISSLVGAGVRAPLDEEPGGPTCCYCPPIWSSQATGRRRQQHKMGALNSEPLDRPVPAVWTVLAAHGGTTTLVNYRNTFPAEPGVTYLVSEVGLAAAARQVFDLQQAQGGEDLEDRLNHTWPPRLFEALAVLPHGGPRLEAWAPFGIDRVSADALAALAAGAPTDLTVWTLHSVDKSEHIMWGTVQYSAGGPIDESNLLAQAARWSGPVTGRCCSIYTGFAWGDVASQYLEADLHIGRLLGEASYDYVVLTSDHAMTLGSSGSLPGAHWTPAAYHGVFALSGPGVRPGESLAPVSLLDVAPTVAYLLGLPVADDLPGRVLTEAFTPEHLAARPIAHVATWP